jgi:tetraprenyl-beta-curcumene synthase
MAMPVVADRTLTARIGLALLLANASYWSTVAPFARTQLVHWALRAENIPNPVLKDVALTNLREEGFNAQASAVLATLAPREYRKSVIEAIIGLQVIYDYLDSLVERPLSDPLSDGRRLYGAFVDAIAPGSQLRGHYYPQTHESEDGGYLEELVGVVRRAVSRLPSHTVVEQVSVHAAARCAEAQVHAHATPFLGGAQLELWAKRGAADTGLPWREFLAGAVSSGLALHALVATAADPCASREQALAIDDLYLSVCALCTLLDGLVDYDQDMRIVGHPGYVRYYDDLHRFAQGLSCVIHRATSKARDVPNCAYHLMTLVGVAAYYISAPTTSGEFARTLIGQTHQELKPLITPTLTVMRTWRSARRIRATIANTMVR